MHAANYRTAPILFEMSFHIVFILSIHVGSYFIVNGVHGDRNQASSDRYTVNRVVRQVEQYVDDSKIS